MGLRVRAFAFIALSAAVWAADVWFDETVQPPESTRAAVVALNGGNEQASALRSHEHFKDAVTVASAVLTIGLLLLCFGTYPSKAGITYHIPAKGGELK